MYADDNTPTYAGAPARALPRWGSHMLRTRAPRSRDAPLLMKRRRGLGLVSALAPVAVSGGASLARKVFGDTPDHDANALRAWAQQVAATGSGICSGPFNVAEVVRAVKAAPEGRPGDPPGTFQGLVTAVARPSAMDGPGKAVDFRPFMANRESAARLAVGVAHGRIDCGVGWQEEPAAVHLRALLENYRNLGPAQQIAQAAGGAVQQVQERVRPLAAGFLTDDNKAAAIFLGLLAVGAVAARIGGRL